MKNEPIGWGGEILDEVYGDYQRKWTCSIKHLLKLC